MKYLLPVLLIACLFTACRKQREEPAPAVQLDTLRAVTAVTSASFQITSALKQADKGLAVVYGHCWSATNTLPTIADQKSEQSAAPTLFPHSFTSLINGLNENTRYYVRAYAIAGQVTVYSDPVTVTTYPGFFALFSKVLEDSLRNRNFGYGYVLLQNGVVKAESAGGLKARTTDPGGEKPYLLDTKMHIASMSKTITAMAFLKLASERGIRTGDPIVNYLPANWVKGPGIGSVTFRDLLTHRSGIIGSGQYCANGSYSENIYTGLKKLIADGIVPANRGNYCYQNANFGLFRVLIPAILGYGFSGDDATDDQQTQQRYIEYVQQNVLEKAGISGAVPDTPAEFTYTYDFPYSGAAGWNQGSFRNTTGAYGWYLTPREAGKLYSSVFTTDNTSVLTQAYKDTLTTYRLGCFGGTTSDGPILYHDGWWYLRSLTYQGIRTAWVRFPNGILAILFVNALHGQNGLFPSRNGDDILTVLNSSYARARQLHSGRAAAASLYLEYPDPH
jgi:CubicO group peptidase (beta-lactamase class C family)